MQTFIKYKIVTCCILINMPTCTGSLTFYKSVIHSHIFEKNVEILSYSIHSYIVSRIVIPNNRIQWIIYKTVRIKNIIEFGRYTILKSHRCRDESCNGDKSI